VVQGLRRWYGRVARLRTAAVRVVDHETVAVSRASGIGWRPRRLHDPSPPYLIVPDTLHISAPDASWLARITASGVFTGTVQTLRIRVATAPNSLTLGLRPFRVDRDTGKVGWERRAGGLEVTFRWTKPRDVHRALADATAALLRARPWDQAGGPVFALDRAAWLDGLSPWPQGQPLGSPPRVEVDPLGRPLGPFQILARPSGGTPPVAARRPVVTAVANPCGRRLLGDATRYRLAGAGSGAELVDDAGTAVLRLDPGRGAEAATVAGGVEKYAVIAVDSPVPDGSFLADALRALGCCGMVFAAADPPVRAGLAGLGLVVVADSGEVSDLTGYALSVEAARRGAIANDPALRRTSLAGDGAMPLPAVSVLLASRRAEEVETCLGYLAAQSYPAMEVVLGLHDYEVPESTLDGWRALLPSPLRVVRLGGDLTLGTLLGRLSRIADGEILAKVDDDDHYGPYHLTDLMIALHTSGAEVVGKGARFVHFPERGETIDRAWAALESFNATPAGGTLMLARSTLQQAGGWSDSSRHVDTDLQVRVKTGGGVVYRTHGLEYVYVRRATGHTWSSRGIEQLVAQAERTYPGLPDELVRPRYPAEARSPGTTLEVAPPPFSPLS
jgi:hypothetical protein